MRHVIPSTRYLNFLPRSAAFFPIEWSPSVRPLELARPFPAVISTYMGPSGRRAYFLELCSQSNLRSSDNIAIADVAFLSNARLRTVKTPQVNTHSCNLCRGHRTTAHSLDSRSVTNTSTPHLPFSLHHTPFCVLFEVNLTVAFVIVCVGRVTHCYVFLADC